MIVANGPPTRAGGVHRPERNIKRKASSPDKNRATVCHGTKAATRRPSENISAIETMIERMKNGILTLSCAPKITNGE